MLGKLFKQEWKALTKVLLPANLLLLVIFLVGACTLQFFPIRLDIYDNYDASVIIFFVILISYVTILIAVSLGSYIYMIVRYYKTMYGDEGYLTHTLPLSVHQLILGKGLPAAIWFGITYLIAYFSAVMLFIGPIEADAKAEISDIFKDAISIYSQATSTPFSLFVALVIITFLISCIYSILHVFAAMSIGQLFRKHKVIGSVAALFALNIIMQILSSVIMVLSGIFNGLTGSGSLETARDFIDYFYQVFGISLALSIIMSIACYYVTYTLNSKKLNLD